MEFVQIYDKGVSQYAYLIGSDQSREAIIIDPQRHIEDYLALAEEKNLKIIAAAETHIHADFISGLQEFVARTPVKTYVSAHGKDSGWGYEWVKDGQNVQFVKDGDQITIGDITLDIIHTPGHTPEHITFIVSENGHSYPLGALTGDFVFVGDLGRPDLLERAAKLQGEMKKGAESLYKTMKKFSDQPESLLIWPGHGAGSACGKSLGNMPYSSWGYEKRTSPALQYDNEQDFVDFITAAQKEPPLYFARMKHHNNKGITLLSQNKQFTKLSAAELAQSLQDTPDILVIDTRTDRAAAMAQHVPGSLYAPFALLSTAAGSVIEDAQQEIILISPEEQAGEAQRRLNNIGYDHVHGYITPDSLAQYFEQYGPAAPITTTDFAGIENDLKSRTLTVIDVRSGSEYEQSHIDGAQHAPYTRLPEFIKDLPQDQTLYIHCGSGARASVAASALSAKGFKTVLINDNYSQAPAEIKAG